MSGSRFRFLVGALIACAGSTACDDPTVYSGLRLSFSAVPDTVAVGDSFEVVFTITNVTNSIRSIRSSYGCLFFLETFRGEVRVPLDGTNYGCAAAFTTFTFLLGDSIAGGHWLVATGIPGDSTAGEFQPGTFRIRTRMNSELPDLEALVVIVDDPAGAT